MSVSNPNFKSPVFSFQIPSFQFSNFKLSVSNPKSKHVAYLSVLSRISSCQGLGRKNKHEILKTDRRGAAARLSQTTGKLRDRSLSTTLFQRKFYVVSFISIGGIFLINDLFKRSSHCSANQVWPGQVNRVARPHLRTPVFGVLSDSAWYQGPPRVGSLPQIRRRQRVFQAFSVPGAEQFQKLLSVGPQG